MAAIEATDQDSVNEVYKKLFTELWEKSCGDFLNFGLFDSNCFTLIEANLNLVDWIISYMGITESSYLLDIACGRGKYTVEIAKRTGCKFLGLDIVEEFVNTAQELSKSNGTSSQGKFVVGNMLDLKSVLQNETFTHVTALGCLFYVHDKMAEFLTNLRPYCSLSTIVYIHDFSRNCPLEQVRDVMKHWRTTASTLHTDSYKEIISKCGYMIKLHRDDTDSGLKSCQWVVDVGETLCSDKSVFTFWVLRDALRERRILHNTFILEVSQ